MSFYLGIIIQMKLIIKNTYKTRKKNPEYLLYVHDGERILSAKIAKGDEDKYIKINKLRCEYMIDSIVNISENPYLKNGK